MKLIRATLAILTSLLVLSLATRASAQNGGDGGGGTGTTSHANIVKIDYTVEFNQVGTKYYGEWYGMYTKQIDWGTNGCSVPGWAQYLSKDARTYSNFFRPSCVIHDFGYRNYGNNHKISMTRDTKNLIDKRLYYNAVAQCKSKDVFTIGKCNAAAADFYFAVQHFGDGNFFGK